MADLRRFCQDQAIGPDQLWGWPIERLGPVLGWPSHCLHALDRSVLGRYDQPYLSIHGVRVAVFRVPCQGSPARDLFRISPQLQQGMVRLHRLILKQLMVWPLTIICAQVVTDTKCSRPMA